MGTKITILEILLETEDFLSSVLHAEGMTDSQRSVREVTSEWCHTLHHCLMMEPSQRYFRHSIFHCAGSATEEGSKHGDQHVFALSIFFSSETSTVFLSPLHINVFKLIHSHFKAELVIFVTYSLTFEGGSLVMCTVPTHISSAIAPPLNTSPPLTVMYKYSRTTNVPSLLQGM